MSQFDVLDALEHIRDSDDWSDPAQGIDTVVKVTRDITDWDAPKEAVYNALSRLIDFGWATVEYRVVEGEDGRTYTKEYYKATQEDE